MPTNPMVMNLYGQNGQMQQGGMQPQGGGMSPEEMQMMMQQSMQQPQQEAYNPFDVGISRAVQSSRAALQMAPDQEARAMRKAMMSFGASVGSQPKVRGFMGNLGQGLKALGAGVSAHDDAEAAAYAENQAQAEKLLAYQMAKQQQEEAMKQQALNNDFRERQFGETQRAHDLQNGYSRDMYNLKKQEFDREQSQKQEGAYLDRIAPSIKTDSANDKVGKQATEGAAFYSEVEDISKKYKELKGLMKTSGINTDDPLVFNKTLRAIANNTSVWSQESDSPERKIAALYEDIRSSNKRAIQTAEKALKDGALTNFTVRYADEQKLFPALGEEYPNIFEKKLDTLLNDARNGYHSAKLSSQLGRFVDKQNFNKVKKLVEERDPEYFKDSVFEPQKPQQSNAGALQGAVRNFRVPKTGEIIPVPAGRQDLIQKWLSVPGVTEVK